MSTKESGDWAIYRRLWAMELYRRLCPTPYCLPGYTDYRTYYPGTPHCRHGYGLYGAECPGL